MTTLCWRVHYTTKAIKSSRLLLCKVCSEDHHQRPRPAGCFLVCKRGTPGRRTDPSSCRRSARLSCVNATSQTSDARHKILDVIRWSFDALSVLLAQISYTSSFEPHMVLVLSRVEAVDFIPRGMLSMRCYRHLRGG